MKLSIVTGVALAMLTGSAANARTSGSDRASMDAQPPLSDRAVSDGASGPEVSLGGDQHGLQPGMVVMDRAGAKVAIIGQVDLVRDGRPAVILNVNGTKFPVLASRLMVGPKGDQATTTLTRSEIRTLEINAD